MSELFLRIINMSISASWLILAVLALRFVLKKAPKWVNVLLWGIVAVRLACPFSIESALSLIPSAETVSPEIMMDWTPEISTGIEPLNNLVNPIISSSFAPKPYASANPLQILIPVSANFWVLGILVMLLYTTISYWRLRRKVREAVLLRDNTYQSENVGSPFVLGIFQPKIYLPYNMDGQNLNHVVAHEQAHIRRRDHWWKPLGFLLLTFYWFNPLMWLAYVLLCRDIELACDENVIKELGNEQRADYSQALVACSVNRRAIAACPLAFGEVGVKERIKSVMNYKKPAFWLIILAVIVCMLVSVCFLTNPRESVRDLLEPGTSWVCDEYQLLFSVDENYVIEGTFVPDGNENSMQTISIGYRFAGKHNAVAEVFNGDWEWAQKAAEDPLLSGKFIAKSGKLILEIEKDNIGLRTEQIVFTPLLRMSNGEIKDNSIDTVIETSGTYTYEELSEMPAKVLLDLFIQNGLVINDDLKASFKAEELQTLFKENFHLWHTGVSAHSHTMYCDLAEQTKAIYDKIAEPSPLSNKLSEIPGGTIFVVDIWDRTKTEQIACDSALEKFWEDETTEYYFSCIKSQHIIVMDNTGRTVDVVTALNEGLITIETLGNYGIEYFTEPKSGNLENLDEQLIEELSLLTEDELNEYILNLHLLELTQSNILNESYPSPDDTDEALLEALSGMTIDELNEYIHHLYLMNTSLNNNIDEVEMKKYSQNEDGTWQLNGHTYKYKFEISGRMPNAIADVTFVYLSNLENITFEQAWKAAGYSSNTADYFAVEDAVLVERTR